MNQQVTHRTIRTIAVMLLMMVGFALTAVAPAAAQGGTGSITIVSATTPPGTTDVFFFTTLGSFTIDDGESFTYSNLAVGTYNLFQSVDTGWQVSASCDGSSNAPLANGVAVTLADGEDVTCTFTYEEVGGSITVIAESDPAGYTGFSYFGDLGIFDLDDGESFQVTDRLPGDYAIFQTIPQAWDLSINCVGGDSTVNADNVTVHLDANEDIVCTFSNTDIGASITVVAASDPAGATGFDFFATTGTFTLDDGQSFVFDSLLPGTYDIFETIPAGFTLAIDCGGANAVAAGTNGVSVTVANNEDVVCTFNNTDEGGSLTVLTTATPAGSTGFFYFGALGTFTQDDGQSTVGEDLLPGDYQVFQTVDPGWILDISCVGADATVDTGNVTVHLDAGEDAVCTFDNTDVGGSITFNNISNPEDGTQFTYFGDLGFHLIDGGDSVTGADLFPGTYEIIQDIPAGWLLDISCSGGDVTVGTNSATVDLDANEDVVCDFTNTYVGGSISFTNISNPADGTEFTYFGDLGFYIVTDGGGHTGEDLYPGDYEIIQDIPQGWDLDISCTGGDVTVASNSVMVQLDANEAIACDFTNTYVGGSITIITENVGSNASQEFSYFTDLGFFVQTDGDSNSFSDLYPNDYEATQSVPAGWTVDASCTGGDFTVIENGVNIHLDANEDIVCTFVSDEESGLELGTVFSDDFESDQGWTVDANGSDTASAGIWERANPEGTYYYGELQKEDAANGDNALVTGATAGQYPGSHDVDGGVTSIQSPAIELPEEGTIMLSFNYYMTHLYNSSSNDYLRVKVVGDTTEIVYEELGSQYDDFSDWHSFEADITAFAGQTVNILIEAADEGGASLVEAGIDDVEVSVIDVLLADDFESDQGWTVDADGSDSATAGQWERANPQGTYYYGRLQRGRTTSGDHNLVTGSMAGSSPGSYDVDGGVTSVRSAAIDLPSITDEDIVLEFNYYFAHLYNAGSDDYFRVTVVGDSSSVVLEEVGGSYNNYSYWQAFEANLNDFAGQTVYILIEAADNGDPSLVEAAVDDVRLFVEDNSN
ncbi:MAG: hypothetical protein AAF614_37780 [Chloroflexota bacterium]